MTAADEFQVMPGNGLSGLVSGVRVFGGSLNFISEKSTVSKNMQHQAEKLAKTGKNTAVFCDRTEIAWHYCGSGCDQGRQPAGDFSSFRIWEFKSLC